MVDIYRGYAFRAAAGVVIVLLAAIVSIFLWQSRIETIDTAQAQIQYFVVPVADNLGLLVESIDRGLLNTRSQIMAVDAADRGNVATALYRDLARSLKYALIPANYAAIDNSGRLLATSRQDNPEPIDLSDRDYFQHQATAGDDTLFVGQPISNRLPEAAGVQSLPFSRGEWNKAGEFVGVLAGTIPANYFASYLEGRAFQPHARISVVGVNGTPLVDLVSDGVTHLAPTDAAPFEISTNDVTASAPIAHSGLSVVATMPIDEVTAGWRRSTLLAAAAMIGLTLILMGGAVVVDRRGRAVDRIRADSQAVMVNAFSGIQDPVILMDTNCQVVLYNAAADVIGLSRDSQVKIFEQFPWITAHGYDALFLEAKTTRNPVSKEIYVEEFDRWFSLLIHPFQTGTVVYARDVTEAKKVSGQLHQAQKMESIGQLAGGVAHDFNNLLTVIIGTMDSVLEASADRPDVRADAELALRAAERAAELTASLLAIGRRQTLNPVVTDINMLLSDLLVLIHRTLKEDVEVDIIQGENLWRVAVDPGKFEAAILNLVVNARDAMPEGGRLSIETSNAALDEIYCAENADVVPGEYVMVAVTDSGTGMPFDVMERAFDPFFSTKAEGKGTGLGLAMVLGFVKQSEGHIKIYSEIGDGTTVKMYLPRAASEVLAVLADDVLAIEGGTERVLLVEDDPMVRQHVATMLTNLGYYHVEATTGAEALAILSKASFDVILSDVTLPGGMSGKDLVDRAQARHHRLRAIFMSGYTRNAIVHNGRLDSGVDFLAKPFRKAELAGMLRKVLTVEPPLKA